MDGLRHLHPLADRRHVTPLVRSARYPGKMCSSDEVGLHHDVPGHLCECDTQLIQRTIFSSFRTVPKRTAFTLIPFQKSPQRVKMSEKEDLRFPPWKSPVRDCEAEARPAFPDCGRWSCTLSSLSGPEPRSGFPPASGYSPSQPTPPTTETESGKKTKKNVGPMTSHHTNMYTTAQTFGVTDSFQC